MLGLVLSLRDSKRLTKKLVSKVSASLRQIALGGVLDDVKSDVIFKSIHIDCLSQLNTTAL